MVVVAVGVAAAIIILAAKTATVMERTVPFQQDSISRVDQGEKWGLAFLLFADAHGGELPTNFAQLQSSASDGSSSKVRGLSISNWDLVSGGNQSHFSSPSRIILLREKESRLSPRGKFVKVYVFADGRAELIRSSDKDFTAVEKQRGFVVQSATN
jgi:hypothetical protein